MAPSTKPASGSALAIRPRSYPIAANAIAKTMMPASTRFMAANLYSLEHLELPGGAAAAPPHTHATHRLAWVGGVRRRKHPGHGRHRSRRCPGFRGRVGEPELPRHVR